MDQTHPTGASSTPSEPQKITLNILSPSSEIGDKLTFNDYLTSTTIAELKLRICDSVGTRPAPERQRLIYRGRPLIQDSATLKDVLTPEAIANSTEHALHLVLPPSVATQSTNPSLAQPHSSTQRPQLFAGQQQGRIPTPPTGHRGGPHMHFAPPHLGHGLPASHAHGHFPPHLQQAMSNHLQALSQQIATQIASHAGQSGQVQLNPVQAQAGQQPPHALQHSFQQVIAQQQQARAAAGQQGVGGAAPIQTNRENSASPMQEVPTTAHSGPPIRASTPANVNTVVRENQGSNGESWRMVIQSTSTVTAQNPQVPRVPTPVNMGLGSPPLPVMPGGRFSSTHVPPVSNMTPGQLQTRILENELSSIQNALMRGTAPAQSVFENARVVLRNVEATEGDLRFRSRLEQLSTQADQLRTNLNNMLLRVVSEQPAFISPVQQRGSNVGPTSSNGESSVYLLSSPSGPQALLISPWGNYSAPWTIPTPTTTGFPLSMLQNSQQPVPRNAITNASGAAPQNPPAAPLQNALPQQQQQQQQANQQGNEARDLLRLLIPLGGHIWLLIRLFGFVYFFTAGGTSRRTILLGGFAFLVFIAQIGVFRPFVQAVWEPLRRHIEGLLPVPGNEPARPPVPGVGARDPPAPNANAGGESRSQQATPQEAAARLLQERERRDTSVLREQIRRLERGVALFVGSLVPGFGERHIAARDAAEAARVAEERRREEAAMREEEQRSAQTSGEENGEVSAAPREESAEVERLPAQGQGQGQPQAAQPPLVEI